jgi:hypothetical protein
MKYFLEESFFQHQYSGVQSKDSGQWSLLAEWQVIRDS